MVGYEKHDGGGRGGNTAPRGLQHERRISGENAGNRVCPELPVSACASYCRFAAAASRLRKMSMLSNFHSSLSCEAPISGRRPLRELSLESGNRHATMIAPILASSSPAARLHRDSLQKCRGGAPGATGRSAIRAPNDTLEIVSLGSCCTPSTLTSCKKTLQSDATYDSSPNVESRAFRALAALAASGLSHLRHQQSGRQIGANAVLLRKPTYGILRRARVAFS